MPINIDDTLKTLGDGISSIAKDYLKNYQKEAQKDGLDLINQLKEDIKTWTADYTSGDISKDQLQTLINSKKTYFKVAALTQVGLTKIQLDQFKGDVFNLITNTILKLI